ncbi:hypothetical protein L209DRAFT_762843 [Thermothelomyces heterothallicus CBS 203.75]
MSGHTSSASSPFNGTIGHLRILTDPTGVIVNPFSPSPGYVNLDPNNLDFKTLKAVLHLGMSMLESPRGEQILVEIGQNAVNYNRQRNLPCLYSDNVNNIPNYLRYFLRTVRGDFYNVYLTHAMRFQGEGKGQGALWGNNFRDYRPKTHGRIKFNRMVIENLRHVAVIAHDLRGRQDPVSVARYENAMKNFEVGSFLMDITVAHEIVHKWVRYLLGPANAGTPPHISFPGTASGNRGESGWYWESRFLGGGKLENVEDQANPLGWRQLGKLYLVRETAQGQMGRELSRRYIQDILSFRFEGPARPATNSVEQRAELLGKPMARVRLENLPAGIPINVAPEEDSQGRISSAILDPINRMAAHNVRVSAPIRPSVVAA